ALRTDFIDMWLLHEPEASDLTDDSLPNFLHETVARKKIGAFGVGSDSTKIPGLLRERSPYCQVVQHDWSVLDPLEPQGGALHIHHRTLTDRLQTLHADLSADSKRCLRWSEDIGQNLARRETLAALMLKAALVLHPN